MSALASIPASTGKFFKCNDLVNYNWGNQVARSFDANVPSKENLNTKVN